MALIECPECGWEVSDTAAACPKCAYRLGGALPIARSQTTSLSTQRSWWPAASIAGRIGVGFALMLLARAGTEFGATTGLLGLIVAGSAIPAWIRHRMERLRSGGDPTLVDSLEDRIAELEHRHREEMTELEERVEFAERLLTKQRGEIG